MAIQQMPSRPACSSKIKQICLNTTRRRESRDKHSQRCIVGENFVSLTQHHLYLGMRRCTDKCALHNIVSQSETAYESALNPQSEEERCCSSCGLWAHRGQNEKKREKSSLAWVCSMHESVWWLPEKTIKKTKKTESATSILLGLRGSSPHRGTQLANNNSLRFSWKSIKALYRYRSDDHQ